MRLINPQLSSDRDSVCSSGSPLPESLCFNQPLQGGLLAGHHSASWPCGRDRTVKSFLQGLHLAVAGVPGG